MGCRASGVVGRRVLLALVVVAGALVASAIAAPAAPVRAGWSSPLTVGRVGDRSAGVALATDARGDTAVVWASRRRSGRSATRLVVNVALARAGGGLVRRAVWHHRDALLGGVAVALDARGELTVAWVEALRRRNGVTGNLHTIRAVYRTPSGRWSPVQRVSSSGPFHDADLRLAVAPDREVLLTWEAHSANAPGLAAAWREPGHRFGPDRAVSRAAGAMLGGPALLFDSGGAAHLYGTVSCGRSHTCATMLSTAPRGHRFGSPLQIAPAPAEFPVVSFGAPGRALIAWEAGDYQDLEPYFATPRARVMVGGSLGAPVALQAEPASIESPVDAVAADDGGGTVGWSEAVPPYPSAARATLAVGSAGGSFSAPSPSASGLIPAMRDGVGDTLLTLGVGTPLGLPTAVSPVAAGTPSPVVLQPAGGGARQPSPMGPSSEAGMPLASLAALVTTQPVGAGAAVAWVAGAKLVVSTWRP